MTLSRPLAIAGMALFVVLLGAVGYAVGAAGAPSDSEVAQVEQAARLAAQPSARREAYESSFIKAEAKGMSKGEESGRQDGAAQGADAGSAAVEDRLAAIEQREAEEAAAEAAAAMPTPEAQCASLLNSPGDYGTCLEGAGQDPGAPLTDYCAAHPEVVAAAGFCPSLNE